ncbi:PEP-CTERM sorting domain-containing protein [Pelomonas sp. KK5]|uniref:PEP-CTERM sorting domain-containing protein n=1 Tax=Pelomonas sp. KK5 TaxID=1855730 RepID=UPI00097BDF52|nr:PEP-CTERM sorting domain-containing protein [Pelomonas sp. KK5]
MMIRTKPIAACMLALGCATGHATTVALPSDGSWQEFTVDNFVGPSFGTQWIDFADGSPLSFQFTVPTGFVAQLTVVDAGFAGDTFTVSNGGAVIGTTSAVAAGTTAGSVVFDFDEALANPAYSRGTFTLAAGSYSIGGALLQSVVDDGGLALNATNGALKLSVTAVPEPASFALLLAGLGVVGLLARRAPRA